MIDAKIEGIREREPRTVYHGTSAGAIEMATRFGPPFELVPLGTLIDRGIVPLGGEITRGGFTIKGVNQDRISTAESMERPLSYALGEHEERTPSIRRYIIRQHSEILNAIKTMDQKSEGAETWPVRRMFYTTGLIIVVSMMRLRQIKHGKKLNILEAKMNQMKRKGIRVPPYEEILDWFRRVVQTTLVPYQELLRAADMPIQDVIAEFSKRPLDPDRAAAWSSHYGRMPKFIEQLKTRPDNILLLYAISLARGETKERMVEEVRRMLDRFEPNVARIVGLAERAFDFDTEVVFDASGFPFDLMNIPVIIKAQVTQYTVNPDEISVYETVDLEKATVYYFKKHEDVIRELSTWKKEDLFKTNHLYLDSTEPQW